MHTDKGPMFVKSNVRDMGGDGSVRLRVSRASTSLSRRWLRSSRDILCPPSVVISPRNPNLEANCPSPEYADCLHLKVSS